MQQTHHDMKRSLPSGNRERERGRRGGGERGEGRDRVRDLIDASVMRVNQRVSVVKMSSQEEEEAKEAEKANTTS